MSDSPSATYWEARYRQGGTSGAGSYGKLAQFKAEFINGFIDRHGIASVLDLGCGDGNLLSMLKVPDYTGVDVSPTSLARCSARFPAHRFLHSNALDAGSRADLALSIDVIFHLIEDRSFEQHVDALFGYATRFVVIYASNIDRDWPSPHVRHRRFTDHVAATQTEWGLQAHVPNRHPFDPSHPDETSFADFFVYARIGGTRTEGELPAVVGA
jgi:SAM-dependent methyltransferase